MRHASPKTQANAERSYSNQSRTDLHSDFDNDNRGGDSTNDSDDEDHSESDKHKGGLQKSTSS